MKSALGSHSAFCASEKNVLPPCAVSETSIISSACALNAGFVGEMPLNSTGSSFSSDPVRGILKGGKTVPRGARMVKESACCPRKKKTDWSSLKKNFQQAAVLRQAGVSRQADISRQADVSPNDAVCGFELTPKEIAELKWGLGVNLDPACWKRYEKIHREKILAQRRRFEEEDWETGCFPD